MKRIFFLIIATSVCSITVTAQITEQPIEIIDGQCTLYGTLTLPFSTTTEPVVLIVAGSGPTDRDGNQMMMRVNSYKMLAFALAQNGIASVRYDKRGVGSSRYAGFDPQNIRLADYAQDVVKWVKELKADRRFSQVVVIGHSEGSMVSMMAAAEKAPIDGIVTVAGLGRSLDQVLKDQLSTQPPQIRDISYEIIDTLKKGHTYKEIPVFLASLFAPAVQPFIISSMKINPQDLIRGLTTPILIVQGDTDLQVRVEDARLLAAANHRAELVILVGMAHTLKECGSRDKDIQRMTVYSNPAIPLHSGLVTTIVNFIKAL